MNHVRSLESMALQAFMDPSEWYIFIEEVKSVAESFPDIVGVLAIGSLVQAFRYPSSFSENRRPGPLGVAYESIRDPARRRIFPGNCSDLDLWVCLRDTPESAAAERQVSLGGVALLEALSIGSIQLGTRQWHDKKLAAFNGYYKNPDLFPSAFTSANDGTGPWMAELFKSMLERQLMSKVPDFVSRVGQYTSKKIPGGFLEVRAFPEAVFNLRPNDVPMDNGLMDRQPFPRIADDQWISPDHTSFVLYSSGQSDVYPFQASGRILGQDIDDHIRSKEVAEAERSYGCILLKPDALENNQVGIIKEKISAGIASFGGRIILEKLFRGLSFDEVREIYPSLSGNDLNDAARYLANGASLGLVVEGPVSEEDMIHHMNNIKGPRVADRSEERLIEGRSLDGTIRDLLPLPGDEAQYVALLPSLFRRKSHPEHRFSEEEYIFYSRNLVHAPDNSLELKGLLRVIAPHLK